MFLEHLFGLETANILKVLGLSVLPIFELRVAIPVAIQTFGFPWYSAYIIAVIGNMLPVPFILLLLEFATRVFGKIPIIRKFLDWLFALTRRKGRIVEKYESIGLMLLVAVPLPITGAWTGSIIAVLLGLEKKRAFISIFLGVLIAGVIVTCLTLLGWAGAAIAGTCLFAIAAWSMWRKQ